MRLLSSVAKTGLLNPSFSSLNAFIFGCCCLLICQGFCQSLLPIDIRIFASFQTLSNRSALVLLR